jgi:hypothetical protein
VQAALVDAGHAFGQPEARVQAALENRIGIAVNLCRFPLAAAGGQTLTKQVEL